MIGTTLAHYRVTGELGSGGMGEVWRAEDTKLGRDVALKVLPSEFGEDSERLERFQREAKVLASLNHPNIAHLYGLESVASGSGSGSGTATDADADAGTGADGNSKHKTKNSKLTASAVTFLVMELVEGEDLSELISRGPIPIDDAISIATQIAEALEAAHESGIVHRDLKPANIKLADDGTVKVLDFGLAKAWEADPAESELSLSPTVTHHETRAGVILGTAAYMSPEQARGKKVDRRADVWSFGVVLWEMLTGAKLFQGETVTDLMAAVLTRELEINQLPSNTPVSVKRLLRRCLEKDPQRRLQWLGDARLELLETEGDAAEPKQDSESNWLRRALPWMVATAMGVVAVASILLGDGTTASQKQEYRFTIPSPDGTVFHLEGLAPGPVALSPDGRRVAFTVRDVSGVIRLGVRSLDEVETRYLDGAEGAQYPFWSPDGSQIGFFTRTGTAIKVIPADGGSVRTLSLSRNGKGGSWNTDDTIIFTPDSNTPIFAVSAQGGEPRQLTTIKEEVGENSHRHPQFLPDGRTFIYLARNVGGPDTHTVMVGSLDGTVDAEVLRSPSGALFVDGQLLYLRGRRLFARAFDPDSLEFSGQEIELAVDVMNIEGAARGVFSATKDVLVFQQGEEHTQSELLWLDRSGATIGRVGDVASYYSLALSPDGTMVAAPVSNDTIGTHDLWICDVERDLRSRVTFDDAEDLSPIWSADGRYVYFISNRERILELYRVTPGETGEPLKIISSEHTLTPNSVSPDGRWMLLSVESGDAGSDLVVFDLIDGEETQPFRATQFNEEHGAFSPGGRWVAYTSDESGRFEVYVTPAIGGGRHWQVSTEGGLWPKWIPDTGELLYQDATGRFVIVQMQTGGEEIGIGTPKVLFGGYVASRLYSLYDPASDGSKVLYRALSNEDPPEPPIVVVNWKDRGEIR